MRRLHRIVGLIALAAFLITGQFMRHHTPPLITMTDSARLMFRSRHIYILAAALVNLMLGLYVQAGAGWRRHAQSAGSALLILSAALLILAFIFEPGREVREALMWSHAGLYALFAGSMA